MKTQKTPTGLLWSTIIFPPLLVHIYMSLCNYRYIDMCQIHQINYVIRRRWETSFFGIPTEKIAIHIIKSIICSKNTHGDHRVKFRSSNPNKHRNLRIPTSSIGVKTHFSISEVRKREENIFKVCFRGANIQVTLSDEPCTRWTMKMDKGSNRTKTSLNQTSKRCLK